MSIIAKPDMGRLFDRIAGTYDSINHLLSLGIDRKWRRKAVKGMGKGGDVLDVAIGTADLTLELLHQGKASKVTGIDLSENMMAIGREKVSRAGLGGKVEFIPGSALQMPFKGSSFDAVTCAYGVRNFSDPDKGLEEMNRVLKDGGELMILEFSYPENPVVRWAYDLYFSHILPFVGRALSKDRTAYTYLNRSVKGFFWGEEMCRHLRDAGFTVTECRPLSFGITTIYRAEKTNNATL